MTWLTYTLYHHQPDAKMPNPNPNPKPNPNPNPNPKQPVAKMRLQTTGKETMNCYVYINTARLPAST